MIVALSPHLDDAVFSCSGYLIARPQEEKLIITVFTKSVDRPTGFALACQLDKGLDASVDYMSLRRAEDERAGDILSCTVEHWDLPEAPHRGYNSAEELFAGALAEDASIVNDLVDRLHRRLRALRPATVLYPMGMGSHVDHLQLVRAVRQVMPHFGGVRFVQYFDQPYTSKHGGWKVAEAHAPKIVTLDDLAWERKLQACRAYTTQVGFQFGGAERIGEALGREEYLLG